MHIPLYILYAESNFLVLSPWCTKNISYPIFHQVTQYINKTARVELTNQVPENSSWEQSLLFEVTVRKRFSSCSQQLLVAFMNITYRNIMHRSVTTEKTAWLLNLCQ